MNERLQKVLARAGLGSRRYCEDLIRSGRVRVNGAVALLGSKVNVGEDQITVDGDLLAMPAENRYIKFHKPVGYLCSTKSQGGRPTIFALINVPERVYPVGRLDMPSEGLLLLTDDGQLTNRLTHPRYQHEKEYRLLFQETPTENQMRRWRSGMTLPDGHKTKPSAFALEQVEDGGAWCRIVMREGRKRQIRSMAAVLGLTVLRLIRIRIASLELGDLPVGAWQDCSEEEVRELKGL